MECLDTETLGMYIDNELDRQVHEDVVAHLRTCQNCAARLRSLQTHDALLRRALPDTAIAASQDRACCSPEALSAYASEVLTPEETRRFDQHLQTCDACLSDVMAMRQTMRLLRREPLLSPPPSLARAVKQERATGEFPSAVEKLATLVIQVARDGIKLLETRLLPEHVRLAIGGQPMPAMAFRSSPQETEAVAFVDVQQTVRALELHVRVLHEEGETVLLHVYLQKQGQPLTRKRIALSSQGRTLYSSNTSSHGEVAFPRLAPGEYTVRIPQEQIETQLILRSI